MRAPREPEGFDGIYRSLISGKIERNPTTLGSLCDAIVTLSPGQLTFPIMQRLCHAGITVTEGLAACHATGPSQVENYGRQGVQWRWPRPLPW